MTREGSELPCERLIRKICGDGWRNLSFPDIDGAWGVAIVRSVLDGVGVSREPWMLRQIATHLGVQQPDLQDAFTRLNLNGVFLRDRIYGDRKSLNNNDLHAWCQYAGIASGATGNVIARPRRKKDRKGPSDENERQRT